jgi:hypothetical protein
MYGTKPYNDAPTIDQGWTDLGSGTSGTNASGIDSGSMQIRVFYKVMGAGESNPTITNTTNSVSGAMMYVWARTGNNYEWVTPVMATGSDTSAGTGVSCAMGSDPGFTAGDYCMGGMAANTDAATDYTAHAFSTSGVTWGSVTNNPSTDLATASGQDMSQTTCYAAVSSGTSAGNTTFTATANASVGEVAAAIVRIRESLSASAYTMPYIGNNQYFG